MSSTQLGEIRRLSNGAIDVAYYAERGRREHGLAARQVLLSLTRALRHVRRPGPSGSSADRS